MSTCPPLLCLNIYSSVCEEVRCICNRVRKLLDQKIDTAILLNDPNSPVNSAIFSELRYQQVSFNLQTKSTYVHEISEFWRTILNDWILWQTTRNIGSFINFVEDLNLLNIVPDDVALSTIQVSSKFISNYLTNEYDLLYPQFPLKVQQTIAPFDIGLENISLESFLKAYECMWHDIGNAHIEAVKLSFSLHNRSLLYAPRVLFKDLAHFLSTIKNLCNHDDNSRVLITTLSNAWVPDDRVHIFYLFDEHIQTSLTHKQVFQVLAKRGNFYVSCSHNDTENCVNYFADICKFESKIHPPSGLQDLTHTTESFCDISQTKIAYDARHNPSSGFDRYSYMLDTNNYSISCKSVESLLKNPKMFFYQNVLSGKNSDTENIKKVKKILTGTMVHSLLNFSPNRCSAVPKIEKINRLIDQRFNEMFLKLKSVLGNILSQYIIEALNFSKFLAYKLAKQLVNYKYIATEVIFPKNSKIQFGQKVVDLNGRADCILTNQPFFIDRPTDFTVNIFDFKIGTYELLCPNKIADQLEDYTGIQIFLYGLLLKKLGFKNVNIQIMRPDKKATSLINVDDVASKSGWLFKKLDTIFTTGIIGENTSTFISDDDNLPISESRVDNEIIALKRQLEIVI